MTGVAEERIHRLVLEGLPLGLMVVNREGKVTLWSAGAEQFAGYFRQDVLGRQFGGEFLLHSDKEGNAFEGDAAPLGRTLREGKGMAAQLSLRTKSGHFLPVKIWTAPLRDENGTVLGAVEVFEPSADSSMSERRQSKLGAFGCLDAVTGALNHSMILAHLKESLSLYALYPVPFSVMCFAVDDLSKVRERYGHAAVEAAVRAVAQTVEHGLRPTDFVGRLLEEEFIAILGECSESDLYKVGERIGKLVRRTGISWWGDTIHVSIAMGGTPARDHDTLGLLLGRAEEALRRCVADGGDRLVVLAS